MLEAAAGEAVRVVEIMFPVVAGNEDWSSADNPNETDAAPVKLKSISTRDVDVLVLSPNPAPKLAPAPAFILNLWLPFGPMVMVLPPLTATASPATIQLFPEVRVWVMEIGEEVPVLPTEIPLIMAETPEYSAMPAEYGVDDPTFPKKLTITLATAGEFTIPHNSRRGLPAPDVAILVQEAPLESITEFTTPRLELFTAAVNTASVFPAVLAYGMVSTAGNAWMLANVEFWPTNPIISLGPPRGLPDHRLRAEFRFLYSLEPQRQSRHQRRGLGRAALRARAGCL